MNNAVIRSASILVLVMTACSSVASPPTDPSLTTVTLAEDDCSESMALICQAVTRIQTHHVDNPGLADLGAAAVRGVKEFSTATGGNWEDCRVELEGFEALCPTLAAKGPSLTSGVESALVGMTSFALDPYSAYFDPVTLELVRQDQAGQVEGIGAVVTVEPTVDQEAECALLSAECRLVIVSTLPDSPAEDAGIQPDDVVVAVDGHPVEGKTIDQVTVEVRGETGTEVTLEIERGSQDLTFEVTRDKIEIPVVETDLVGDVGYLRLNMFTSGSGDQVDRALEDLFERGARRLIFDLRDNPGGTLISSIEIASEFVDEGVIVSTVDRDHTTDYPADGRGRAVGVPTIVVVNAASASASEVVTGALQDAGAAVVVGERTFGKNTVQQSFDLDNGGAIKLTIARWITRTGRSLDEGVVPDHQLDLSERPDAAALVSLVEGFWP